MSLQQCNHHHSLQSVLIGAMYVCTSHCACALLGRGDLGLDAVHNSGVGLERPRQHVGGHRRRGAKQRGGGRLRARHLAVERGDRDGGRGADAALEVEEAAREDEHLAPVDGAAEEPAAGGGRGDEAHLQGALGDEEDLRGARVRVRRGHAAPRRVVGARHRHAQRVEPRDRRRVRRRDRRPRRVARVHVRRRR